MALFNTSRLLCDKPKLLDQLRGAIRLRHYGIRTEETYVQWVRRFILFHGKRHPQEMGPPEMESFLTHLAVEKRVSSSTQNQALHAIAFLYKEVLKREMGTLGEIVRAKTPERIPVVFAPQEAKAILARLDGINRLMADCYMGPGCD